MAGRALGWFRCCCCLLAGFLVQGQGAADCGDSSSCEAHVQALTSRLEEMRGEMRSKQLTLQTLEELRLAVLTGKRIELPSAQRQHLERGSPLIGEVSFDARHRPVSTNLTRHFQHLRSLAPELEVRFHAFLPLKRSSQKLGPAALVVVVDALSTLSLFSSEGECVLSSFDLGHGPAEITQVALSPSQENHFVLTADDQGEVRVHGLKVTAKRETKGRKRPPSAHEGLGRKEQAKAETGADTDVDTDASTDADTESEPPSGGSPEEEESAPAAAEPQLEKEQEPEQEPALEPEPERRERERETDGKRLLVVTPSLSSTFSALQGPGSDVARRLTAVLPIDRGSQTYFLTGDSAGCISVFHRNGTLKGRVKVTDDPGGVRGLQRSQGQMVLFYSSHSFGFFSSSQVDVQYPPCTGWNSPLFDVTADPSAASSRVILALSDGDILVYSTTRGKSKACDLSLKFPHVSPLPFRLHGFRGHVLGLSTPLEDTPRGEDYLRELFFFNLASMDAGYGAAPSRSVTLQVSFKPQQPEHLAIFATPSGSSGDRAKSQVAIHFRGARGLELYDLSLKTPPAPKSAGTTEESWMSGSSWLGWFPKLGIFGVALVGVVLWNLRKVTSQRKHDQMDDFDDEYFKERLRERREKRERDKREAHKEEMGGLGSMDD